MVLTHLVSAPNTSEEFPLDLGVGCCQIYFRVFDIKFLFLIPRFLGEMMMWRLCLVDMHRFTTTQHPNQGSNSLCLTRIQLQRIGRRKGVLSATKWLLLFKFIAFLSTFTSGFYLVWELFKINQETDYLIVIHSNRGKPNFVWCWKLLLGDGLLTYMDSAATYRFWSGWAIAHDFESWTLAGAIHNSSMNGS